MTKIKRKKLLIVIIFSTVLIITSCTTYFSIKTTSLPTLAYTIVIDAGHGGVDPGSVGRKTKTTEADINLAITFKLKDYLTASGINCILTRNNQNGLYGTYGKDYKKRDMEARKEIIENAKPTMLISIHQNSFTSSELRGAQVFYNTNNDHSEILANCIQQYFAQNLQESNKGSAIGEYYIIKCTNIPSVLCECGYLSNANDEALLIDADYQSKIAYSIYSGIIYFLNL